MRIYLNNINRRMTTTEDKDMAAADGCGLSAPEQLPFLEVHDWRQDDATGRTDDVGHYGVERPPQLYGMESQSTYYDRRKDESRCLAAQAGTLPS